MAGKVHAPVLCMGQKLLPQQRNLGGCDSLGVSFGSSLGGADKNVVVFDKSSEQILATLKGHTKKVTSVVFHPSQVRGSTRHPLSPIPEPFQWCTAPSLLGEAGLRKRLDSLELALRGPLCGVPFTSCWTS